MNKAELVSAMAEKTELSKKDAEAALKAFTDVVAEELKKGETELDDDMSAVTNLYTQIALVIEAIYKNCGYRPQIIISDHADKLNLNGFDFESFIRARWRKSDDGLINLKIIEEKQK